MPREIKPPPAGAKIVFVGEFDSNFGFTPRERRSPSLDQTQTDALEIKANLSGAGNIKPKDTEQDKGKEKEE